MADNGASMEGSSFLDRKRRGGKSIWEWMQVLIVPLAIALVTIAFSIAQNWSLQRVENQRAQDAALQAYIDQISNLLLEKDLRSADLGDTASVVARARTLTVLRRLDPVGKGDVVRFLIEAQLVSSAPGHPPVISLNDADLEDARLWGVNLPGAELADADLSGAYLLQAILPNAILVGAELRAANLRSANLMGTELAGADLRNADLSGAALHNAVLAGVDFRNANLNGATGITNEELEKQTNQLEGATMPDGSKHP
jgi:uncharacterized protein YjbI with pentapeptide repeats